MPMSTHTDMMGDDDAAYCVYTVHLHLTITYGGRTAKNTHRHTQNQKTRRTPEVEVQRSLSNNLAQFHVLVILPESISTPLKEGKLRRGEGKGLYYAERRGGSAV